MTTLREQLLELKAKVAERTSEEFRTITEGEVQKLIESQEIEGLPIGAKAPDFTLSDAEGNLVSLSETLQKGPVILSFYRGSW